MENLDKKIAELQEQVEQLKLKSQLYESKYKDAKEKVTQYESLQKKMPFHYKYPHPAIATDCVLFSLNKKNKLQVLLIQRGNKPYKDIWALPGGFLQMGNNQDETLEECIKREIHEETGYEHIDLIDQLKVSSEVDRDPRERVISVAYYGLVKEMEVKGGDDAKNAKWFTIDKIPDLLAFDHAQILAAAREKLKEQLFFKPIVFTLLPETFRIYHLQKLYETILGTTFDRRNFYKKMMTLGLVEVAEERIIGSPNNQATKYRFIKTAYEDLKNKTFKQEF